MINITHNNLPEAVTALFDKVQELKSLITNPTASTEQPPAYLSIEQAAKFLGVVVPTMYSKVSKGEIKHYKRGKRLYFLQSDIQAYISEGARKTKAEQQADAAAEANSYLTSKKRK